MIKFRNAIIRKEISENKNPNKLVNIVEKILNFHKKQKSKELPSDLATQLKILTPKQMLQRLPIALAQVKVGNIHLRTC